MGSRRATEFYLSNFITVTVILACGLEALTEEWEDGGEEVQEEEEEESWEVELEGDHDICISQDEVYVFSDFMSIIFDTPTHAYMHIHTHAHTHTHTCTRTRTHTHTQMHAHTYVYCGALFIICYCSHFIHVS